MPFSPELAALLAACRQAPDDDVPRLVLADWLDEQGDSARAHFIRVQCELSHPTADVARMNELKNQQWELLRSHAAEWLAGYEKLPWQVPNDRETGAVQWMLPWEFRRGLLNLEIKDALLLERPDLIAWLQSDAAQWVGRINLAMQSVRHFTRLRLPRGCQDRLWVTFSINLGEAGLSPSGQLEVRDPDTDWLSFVSCHQFKELRGLELSINARHSEDKRRLGLDFLHQLASLPENRLVALHMNCGTFSTEAAQVVAEIPFSLLSSLDLGPLTTEGLKYLIRSPHLTRLYTLKLEDSRFGDEGLRRLVESPLAHSLGNVTFPNRDVGDQGIVALVESPLFGRLVGPLLNLKENFIGDVGVSAIAGSPHLARFRELVLAGNRVGNEGVTALAYSESAQNLMYIDLGRNRIGDDGGLALAQSPYLTKVVDLYLKGNAISEPVRAQLRERYGSKVKV